MRATAARWGRKVFAPSMIAKLVREAFARFGRRADEPMRAQRAPAPARRQGFMLEPIEPRLLLSADLSYFGPAANPSATQFWLKAINSTQVQLFDSATDTSSTHEATLSAFTIASGTVTIDRALGDSGIPDTVHLVTDTFAQLDPGSTGITGNGNKLEISFDGGDQRVFQDSVLLDDSASTDLTQVNHAFGLSVTSNSQISATNTSISVTGDLGLISEQKNIAGDTPGGKGVLAITNPGITLTGAHLTASGSLTLQAHAGLNITSDGSNQGDTSGVGDYSSSLQSLLNSNVGSGNNSGTNLSPVVSVNVAKIDIGGGSVPTATSDHISITSNIDQPSFSANANGNGSIKLGFIVGLSDPQVAIHGASTSLVAGGKIDASATTNLSPDMEVTPGSNSDSSKDAAVALTVFDSEASLSVTDQAQLTTGAGKAATLSASSTLNATTKGDATGGTAGAGVAVSVVFGDTSAYLDNATVTGGSLSLGASSDRTLITTAKSSTGGSSDGGGGSTSQTALSNNKASTDGSANNVNVAGAVAVNIDTGSTSAYFKNASIDVGTGTASVTAESADKVTVTADGSNTGDTSSTTNGLGIAVAINVADRSDSAYVTGASNILNAGALKIEVLEPNSSSFDVEAKSGVGDGSNVGAAGALAINVVVTNHQAYIDGSASIKWSGSTDVTIDAHANVTNTEKADANQSGGKSKIGVGASVAFDYSEDTTAAYVGDNATFTGSGGVHDLTLAAESTHKMGTEATGGTKGGTSVTPVVAISVANDTAYATLGAGGLLSVGRNFSASSSLADNVSTTATGDTTSGKTGVGISIALSIVNDTSYATTGRDQLTAGGTAAFLSSAISGSQSTAKASVSGGEQDGEESKNVDGKVGDQKTFANNQSQAEDKNASGTKNSDSPSSDTSQGPVSVAGAVAVNIEHGNSSAYIGDSHNVTSTGTLTVKSAANVDGSALADSSAVIGQVTFNASDTGSGGDVNTTNNTIHLGDSSGLKTGDKVTYFTNGGTAIKNLSDDTDYYVRDAGSGDFKLYKTANDASSDTNAIQLSTAGSGTQALRGGGAGGTGVGAAVSVNYAKDTNLAYIGQATISAGGLDIEATQAERDLSFDAATKVSGNKIDVGQSGLRTGDAVTYDANKGTPITGIDDKKTYYVNVQSDGTLELYDTKEHALAGGSTGLKA